MSQKGGIWAQWTVNPWWESKACYSHRLCLIWMKCAALTAWYEHTHCSLSWKTRLHLSTNWTCSEHIPLCFEYGRYYDTDLSVKVNNLDKTCLSRVQKHGFSVCTVCFSRFPWQHVVIFPVIWWKASVIPLLDQKKAKIRAKAKTWKM